MTDTVRVRLVWPESRGAKNDCRAGTAVVWSHHGDVQDYPAALWPRLAAHPDVWQLVPSDTQAAPPPTPLRPLDPIVVKAAKEHARGLNTDLVVAVVDTAPLDEEQLAAMADADIHELAKRRGYVLHPRLNPINLRARFLEAQAGAPTGAEP